MEIISFVGVVILLILFFNLRERVLKLEKNISINSTQPTIAITAQPLEPQTGIQATPIQPIIPEQTGPGAFSKFADWLKEDWLLKLGALLLLIGFGWFVTYAFLNNWIGPMGRIALGVFIGALILILGWFRIKKYLSQGSIFLVLGSTVILLTLFAAREMYDFFTPLTTLSVMFLSTAFVAIASVKYNRRSLALASLILAGVAPLLTNSPSNNYVALFSYLLVVTLGAIWIVVLTGRRELTAAALILITLYSLPHLLSFTYTNNSLLLIFAYIFTTLFFLTNTIGVLKLKDKEIIPDLVTAAGNGLFILAWIMTTAKPEWRSLIISAWMIVFAVGSFLIFKITNRREPFYVYAGIGIALLGAATAAELNGAGATLTIAYTVEVAMISIITYLILKDIQIAKKMSWLLVVPVILSFESITSYAWRTNVLHKDFFVLLVLSLIMLWLGMLLLRNKLLLITGSVYFYILLWLSLRAALPNNDTAVMISLTIYTIIGLVSYFYGLANNQKTTRLYGGILVGLVVARLLLIDIWDMNLVGKTITFFLIGTILMSTAFLGRKKSSTTPIPNSNNQ
ncbi:MAG: DUF2339 domain-containing protein [Patescibacteria group bacterium]